jgi:hypothetical protein
MKKTVFLSLIICVLITSAFSKDGYKIFKWGMSSEQVIKLGQTIVKSDSPYDSSESLRFVICYLYGIEEVPDTILNPHMILDPFDVIVYENDLAYDDRLEFLFINNKNEKEEEVNEKDEKLESLSNKNKLVGVVTHFKNASIIYELEKKYGEGVDVGFMGRKARVWLDNERFIVWSTFEPPYNHYTIGLEFIAYLNAEWAKQIYRECIQIYEKEEKQKKLRDSSRLD